MQNTDKTIRQLPVVEDRVETGTVRFGDDWAGVFIRGDTAYWFGLQLESYLKDTKEQESCLLSRMEAQNLVTLLFGAIETRAPIPITVDQYHLPKEKFKEGDKLLFTIYQSNTDPRDYPESRTFKGKVMFKNDYNFQLEEYEYAVEITEGDIEGYFDDNQYPLLPESMLKKEQ